MKKITILFATMIMIAISANVMAQNTATAEGVTATARVMTPIAISADANGLEFGTFSSSSVEGTVVIAALEAGTRTSTGGVTLSDVLGTQANGSAEFTVTGEAGASYSVTLPSTITLSNGSETMNIESFESNSTNVLTGGTQTFYVGATLKVKAAQASGNYTGTYDVTVAYN